MKLIAIMVLKGFLICFYVLEEGVMFHEKLPAYMYVECVHTISLN